MLLEGSGWSWKIIGWLWIVFLRDSQRVLGDSRWLEDTSGLYNDDFGWLNVVRDDSRTVLDYSQMVLCGSG